jgi:hypothetical protein
MKSPAGVSQRTKEEDFRCSVSDVAVANCRPPRRRWLLAAVVALLLAMAHAAEAINVISKEPQDGTIVPEGKQVRGEREFLRYTMYFKTRL